MAGPSGCNLWLAPRVFLCRRISLEAFSDAPQGLPQPDTPHPVVPRGTTVSLEQDAWPGPASPPLCPLPPLLGPRQGVLRLHAVLRGLAIAHEQRQVVQAQPPEAVPVTEAAHRLRQDIRTEVPMMQGDMRHPLRGVSATARKRTKTGKMKMQHFSGTKFASGLAWETQNPLPWHKIRRKRI
jgi:hypothetical protein